MQLDQSALDILREAPVNYEALADAMSEQQREKLVQELDSLAQAAVFAAMYFEHRGIIGFADQGHDKAVKVTNKALAKVRKMLGYSYPVSAQISF